ncbi:MAG TPA: sel1 repeat family protein [Ghiorsea sp.]|nr:sel1 repeat family protein [Ghiorsea sp.]
MKDKVRFANKACRLDIGYCHPAARLLGGTSSNKGRILTERMCKDGHIGKACLDLAKTSQNPSNKVMWLLKGCESDSPEACTALAHAYESGAGVDKDTAKAKALYRAICTSYHYQPACSHITSYH